MTTLLLQATAAAPAFPWGLYGWSALAVSLTMVALWALLVRIQRTSLVDVAWTAALGVLALVYAAVGPGWGPRRLLLGILVGIWAARLAGHLWNRLQRDGEDGRYDAMREAFSDLEADSIYVLSDGQPTNGEVRDPFLIRQHVARWNELRGVKIHSISIGPPLDVLRWLAEDSGGQYRWIQ